MIHALTDPMTTETGRMFVTCDPLQPREELLGSRQMVETQGGWGILIREGLKLVAKYVVPVVQGFVAGYLTAEATNDDKEKPSSCCRCSCKG